MPDPLDHLQTVGDIVQELRALGLGPVLVGGMALVVLGSRRVTRDFDFVVAQPGERLARTIALFYDRGFELVSRVNDAGDVVATISSRRVAAIRLRLDAPASAYFFNATTGLRIDLLFDFPISAATLRARATATRIRTYTFDIASEEDLLRLKQIAKAARSAPGDAHGVPRGAPEDSQILEIDARVGWHKLMSSMKRLSKTRARGPSSRASPRPAVILALHVDVLLAHGGPEQRTRVRLDRQDGRGARSRRGAREPDPGYGRVLSWIVFSAGCESMLKGAGLVRNLVVPTTKDVL